MDRLKWKEIGKIALRVFGYQVAFGFIGFMLVPSLLGLSAVVRLPLVGLLIVGALMLVYLDGSYHGAQDCAMSERLDKLRTQGTYTPSGEEVARRYWPMKGIWGALLAAVPLLLCALYLALTVQPYRYALQDLPAWLSAYTHRPEVGDALRYLAQEAPAATATDYVRMVVRFALFPYVGLIGIMNDAASLLFDRLSPLVALILPTASVVGYLFGPRRRAKEVKAINAAKQTPRKRLKKDKKTNTPREKQQLV